MSFQAELNKLADFEDISFDASATTADGKNAKEVFCKGWPSAKAVLQSIAAIIKNPLVKIGIGAIVSAGDGLSAKICTQ